MNMGVLKPERGCLNPPRFENRKKQAVHKFLILGHPREAKKDSEPLSLLTLSSLAVTRKLRGTLGASSEIKTKRETVWLVASGALF